MQEDSPVQAGKAWPLMRQWVICVVSYALIWAYSFSLLWFLESSGPEYLRHPEELWSILLALAWNTLCPDWPFLATGLLLGLLTCACLPRAGGAVKSSLLWSLLPAGGIFAMFGFTASGFLPALLAVAASYLAATVVARAWQQPLFSVPIAGSPLAPRKVIVVLVWLAALGVPFRLFDLLGAAWSRGMGTEVTQSDPAPSPDGAYVAVIHNVNPGAAGDYSDVIVRPRHTVLDLFHTNSASSQFGGIGRIQWAGRHTLYIWRDYNAGQEQWHDVRIVYKDTRSAEERKKDAWMK